MTDKKQSDRLSECLKTVQKAVFRDPLDVAKHVDVLFAGKEHNLILRMALSRDQLGEYRKALTPHRAQEIAAALLLVKGQNDILAGYHLLRSGYNTRVIYFFRLACESICQAILIFKDKMYFADFKADKTRADKSIQKAKALLPLAGLADNNNEYLAWLCNQKNKMNRHSHSTVHATLGDHVQLHPSFGPSYAIDKEKDYNSYEHELSEMTTLIGNLADWMKQQATREII